jgi:DNA polymerase III epsilon subunit-like protein
MYNLFLDLETTGLPETISFHKYYDYKLINKYENARIISICMYIYDNNENLIEKFYSLIKPDNFEVKNSEIHGLTQDILLKEGKEWKDIIEQIQNLIKISNLIIGHNINFDKNVLCSELYRNDFENLANILYQKETYCTMINGKNITKIQSKYDYKYPKLSELYKHFFHEEIKNHHNAEYDVINCAKCYFKIIKGK